MSIEEWKSEDGQAMTEYGLLIGILVVALLLVIGATAGSIVNLYEVRIRPILLNALVGR
ncbi:hypothetical protein HMPREF9013_0301 [Bulleidia extructa W1219]|uniref:Flp/Fap pilin component n=1 Tax=Bulleidia extructa W1219 TaxID=679192 RepID=D2MPR4_9FIRM|nr:hypothetical protein [Bulleidia extructa]EFC05367.1 hypothetical protein HMPREF9013_0301 [Bulleidia extructa W1219]